MSLQTRISALITAIGADIKDIYTKIGTLSGLTTTAKTNLVAAINEVKATADSAAGGGATINDAATGTGSTWSSSKINTEIGSQAAAAVNAIVSGAPAALDTLDEIAAALNDDANVVSGLVTAVGNRVRFDAAQSLTTGQQAQACANIGVGDPETDLAALYTTAKA